MQLAKFYCSHIPFVRQRFRHKALWCDPVVVERRFFLCDIEVHILNIEVHLCGLICPAWKIGEAHVVRIDQFGRFSTEQYRMHGGSSRGGGKELNLHYCHIHLAGCLVFSRPLLFAAHLLFDPTRSWWCKFPSAAHHHQKFATSRILKRMFRPFSKRPRQGSRHAVPRDEVSLDHYDAPSTSLCAGASFSESFRWLRVVADQSSAKESSLAPSAAGGLCWSEGLTPLGPSPSGTLRIRIRPDLSCPGFGPESSCIELTYNVPAGIQRAVRSSSSLLTRSPLHIVRLHHRGSTRFFSRLATCAVFFFDFPVLAFVFSSSAVPPHSGSAIFGDLDAPGGLFAAHSRRSPFTVAAPVRLLPGSYLFDWTVRHHRRRRDSCVDPIVSTQNVAPQGRARLSRSALLVALPRLFGRSGPCAASSPRGGGLVAECIGGQGVRGGL